jgi:hypothetical protein
MNALDKARKKPAIGSHMSLRRLLHEAIKEETLFPTFIDCRLVSFFDAITKIDDTREHGKHY